ncbi:MULTISPECIES: hypothetical protein [Paenibacillus]|uniref:Uncharacterized protein n=1 Tax=Paenibacillus lutrae TaxID=2078573 RepID=A0A7X3FKV9_9BACL|nr:MULTISPECIES: hypothetical protein [Paenibacillus]MVP01595.1 hypothetical protein [Paenibacillus lutrae]
MNFLKDVSADRLGKWLGIYTLFFFLCGLVIAYLGGDHDYISYQTGVILGALLLLPGLFLLIALYIKADRQTRKGYNLRLLLVLALVAAKYAFF